MQHQLQMATEFWMTLEIEELILLLPVFNWNMISEHFLTFSRNLAKCIPRVENCKTMTTRLNKPAHSTKRHIFKQTFKQILIFWMFLHGPWTSVKRGVKACFIFVFINNLHETYHWVNWKWQTLRIHHSFAAKTYSVTINININN